MKRIIMVLMMMMLLSNILMAGTYSGGSGTSGDPYQIATTDDLIDLSNNSDHWSDYFIQTADISFNADETQVDWDGDGSADWDAEDQKGFSPIGNSTTEFTGQYDGGDTSLPVELASFSARCEGQSVILEWITASEVDNVGFILERKTENADWIQIASYKTHNALRGQGNTSHRTEYTYVDHNVASGKTYSYRLSDVNTRGKVTPHEALSVKMDNVPETTEMDNAYPNPFNPQTYIAYHLAENTEVRITVYDVLGRSVKTLFKGNQKAGSYHHLLEW